MFIVNLRDRRYSMYWMAGGKFHPFILKLDSLAKVWILYLAIDFALSYKSVHLSASIQHPYLPLFPTRLPHPLVYSFYIYIFYDLTFFWSVCNPACADMAISLPVFPVRMPSRLPAICVRLFITISWQRGVCNITEGAYVWVEALANIMWKWRLESKLKQTEE